MIAVDCADVLPIQHELLVYVSDEIEAIPVIKHHKFILSPIESDGNVDPQHVSSSIKKYLDCIGEGNNFDIINSSGNILIKSVNGKKIDKDMPSVKTVGTCCGL